MFQNLLELGNYPPERCCKEKVAISPFDHRKTLLLLITDVNLSLLSVIIPILFLSNARPKILVLDFHISTKRIIDKVFYRAYDYINAKQR